MIQRRIVERYVKALLGLAAEQGKVEAVEQELKAVDRLLKDNVDLMNLLVHPKLNRLRKKKFLDEVFGSRVSALVKSFLDFLVEKKREPIVAVVYEEYQRAADKLRGIVKARVRSVVAMTAQQQQQLAALLERRLGSTVEVQLEVDKDLLGGLQIFIENDILDGSIRGRLNALQKYLLEANLR